jgi:putative sterol carrier protein
VAAFLTDAWFDALDEGARSAHLDEGVRVVIQQVVLDGADGTEVAYAVRAVDGAISIHRGRVADADVTFTQDRATAEAIHRGELSAQSAFIEGRLRLGGDLRAVIERATALAALDDVFRAARA